MIIAIDGPAASGKSTTAKLLGKKIGFLYIDTGAMYRAMTLKVKKENIDYTDKESIVKLLPITKITQIVDEKAEKTKTFLDGEDVSDEIRTPEITRGVTPVCEIGEVRKKLVSLQREMGEKSDVILDGRDIGTVVFPNADYKFYMVADLDIRARRREKEMLAKGFDVDFEEVKADIANRDKRDSTRTDSPMKPSTGAIHIDTSKMDINEQVNFIIDTINK